MLRTVLVLLLLANAAFYAWTRGWLAPVLPPRAEQREPERLTAQVRPELITVLTPKAASAAVAAAAATEAEFMVCLEAGPFTDSTVLAAETALSQHSVPDGAVTREAVATSFTWGVVMGRFADRDHSAFSLISRFGGRLDRSDAVGSRH